MKKNNTVVLVLAQIALAFVLWKIITSEFEARSDYSKSYLSFLDDFLANSDLHSILLDGENVPSDKKELIVNGIRSARSVGGLQSDVILSRKFVVNEGSRYKLSFICIVGNTYPNGVLFMSPSSGWEVLAKDSVELRNYIINTR